MEDGLKVTSQQKPVQSAFGYTNGAFRSIEVGLRVAKSLKLPPDLQIRFLEIFGKELFKMHKKGDRAAPFIDRAVNATLLRLQSESPKKK